MQFKFSCPHCGSRLEADASYSGSLAECPGCDSSVLVPEPRIGPGSTIGGHRLERLIGRGGMGEVYLATQLAMQRQVAVKVLPPSLTRDETFVGRFLIEVRTAAKLEHPNIVTAFDAGEDAGIYYLAMGFVDGETLKETLTRDGPLPQNTVLDIGLKLAKALGYAWENFGILHRDIKPANVMRDRFGEIKLMDMGVAKIVGEDTGLTLTGVALGTPNYMSPEQVRGLQGVDCRADIYSLGCTLFHLLTGHQPYPGANPLQVMDQHVHAPIPSLRAENPAVSRECEQLVHRMMAKDPAARPRDWRETAAQIEAARGHLPSAGMPRPAPSPGWTWKRWTVVGAAGFLVLLLLASAAGRKRARERAAAAAGEAGAAGAAAVPAQEVPRLMNVLEDVAEMVLDRKLSEAQESWQRTRGDFVPLLPEGRIGEIDRTIAAIADFPGHTMRSFEGEVGREITVRLK
ncbi:MAG: protein kinase, partial [Lentisphaeria bacterium]|nr:protein kinase [Lentisphaeria bacterium]